MKPGRPAILHDHVNQIIRVYTNVRDVKTPITTGLKRRMHETKSPSLGFPGGVLFWNSLESLVNLMSIILRKCSPRNRLPITTIKSCVTFSLPPSTAGLLPAPPEREGQIHRNVFAHQHSLP